MSGLFRARIILDEVRPPDADALVEIHGDAFARSWSSDDFAALIADRTVFALALRRQRVFGRRRLVGFALVRSVADEAEILTIAVAPADRGRGFGRLLMEEAMRRLYRGGRRGLLPRGRPRPTPPPCGFIARSDSRWSASGKAIIRRAEAGEGTALVMRAATPLSAEDGAVGTERVRA